jgi:hypothetical protein
LFTTFGDDLGDRREQYRKFLKDFDEEEERWFDNLELPLGGQEFLRRLIKEKGMFLPKRRGRVKVR